MLEVCLVEVIICLCDAAAAPVTPLLDAAPPAVCPLLVPDMIAQFSHWAVGHFKGAVSISGEAQNDTWNEGGGQ